MMLALSIILAAALPTDPVVLKHGRSGATMVQTGYDKADPALMVARDEKEFKAIVAFINRKDVTYEPSPFSSNPNLGAVLFVFAGKSPGTVIIKDGSVTRKGNLTVTVRCTFEVVKSRMPGESSAFCVLALDKKEMADVTPKTKFLLASTTITPVKKLVEEVKPE